jgi:hypothetical protein
MDMKFLAGFIALGAIFGILGGAVAFISAYEGYSHYPGIPKRKRIIISFQYAVAAFIMLIIGALAVGYFIYKNLF